LPQRRHSDDDQLRVIRAVTSDPPAVAARIVVVVRNEQALTAESLEALHRLERKGERIAHAEFPLARRERDPVWVADSEQVEHEALFEIPVRIDAPAIDQVDLLLPRSRWRRAEWSWLIASRVTIVVRYASGTRTSSSGAPPASAVRVVGHLTRLTDHCRLARP
jgi:hypothetical protein